jgi:pimeloyl-ACP methyl ester carboxylesterase
VRQFPLFVEAGEAHVASVVTIPDGEPRGVVISLAGTGRHNLIGSTICAHLSQRVAERELAHVRLDYAGVGDSPGLVPTWLLSDVGAAARQARAVLGAVREALGLRRFVAVGTCYGSRVALSLVSDPDCCGAVCLAVPVLDHGGFARVSRSVGERTVFSYVRSHAALRRLADPLRRTLRPRKPAAGVVGAFEHLDRATITFLYGRIPQEDHYSRRAGEVLDAALAQLPPERRERFELRMLEWGPLSTFDILPPGDKEEVVNVVLRLIDAAFEDVGSAPAPGRLAASTPPGSGCTLCG